jgi:nitrate reductase NapE
MTEESISSGNRRQREWRAFLFLTVVLFPLLAVAVVAGFGFLVWIWQMFSGPPGA